MKILIIRFSSIGDIILTTPVVRCLKEQLGAEVHFLVKKSFANVLSGNPYIDRVYEFGKWDSGLMKTMREEKFDHIIDLHKNLRSRRVIFSLQVASTSFSKLNFQKWLMTALKINVLPKVHIVERYFKAIEKFGVKDDGKGLDFIVSKEQQSNARHLLTELGLKSDSTYVTVAIGAARKTKLPTANLYTRIINSVKYPIVLVGGPSDTNFGEEIISCVQDHEVINAAGKLSLQESASVIKNSMCLVTPDTGLMHAGAALKVPMVVIWGNTIPEFGMYPWYAKGADANFTNHEVNGLSCRPCSKIGYAECPKKHFNCMNLQKVEDIVRNIQSLIDQYQKKLN